MTRRLVHIPIIHTAADLGSLSDAVRARYANICGGASWNQREEAVQALWAEIQRRLDALRLDGPATRLYQDGLPVCGFEDRIVRELANAGSVNHQILVGLMDRGAALMGTEDPQLLMEEYDMQKQALGDAPGDPSSVAVYREHSARLLRSRDAFIAERIAATLQPGETGLLFLGALHKMDSLPRDDIRLERLL